MQAQIINGELRVVNDFTYADHGSIVILTAHTPEARAWADEHLPHPEGWELVGGGRAIEWRCFPPIANSILDDGLAIDTEQA